MRAYVLLRSSPYMAKTDADGRFVIKNVPVGKHTFQTWHEKMGYLREVEFSAMMTDSKGRLNVEIQPGKNDAGVASLSIDQLNRD